MLAPPPDVRRPWLLGRAVNDTTRKLVELCSRLREAVLPSLGSHAARVHAGVAVGGDVTFGIDELAENLLAQHMRASFRPGPSTQKTAGCRVPKTRS